jgi:two-component system chemotaxis sensor kinase CheA
MDRDALRARLMVTFLGELDEHVQALTRDLLAVEREPASAPDRLASLFRTAHSLKGAARAVSLSAIETTCHQLESLLGAARDGRQPLQAETVGLLFDVARALSETAGALRAQRADAEAPLVGLLPALIARAPSRSTAPGAARHAPRPGSAPPDAAPRVPPIAAPPAAAADGRVRVPADQLDALLAGSGELLVARRRAAAEQGELQTLHERLRAWRREWRQLEGPLRGLIRTQAGLLPRRAVNAVDRATDHLRALERRVDQLTTRAAAAQHAIDRAAETLEQEIRRVRMFPFDEACDTVRLSVHELARSAGKQVDLHIEGGGIQLDRLVLERIRDPLLHLVRNAVDHGIEAPAERRAAGLPPVGTVTVSARVRGETVEIAVSDDGRGLVLHTIRSVARRAGLPEPADARAAAALILHPGFTTAPLITALSGRGVGLDVVRHQVEALQGHVDIHAGTPRGLRVVLTVPLTVTTLRALLVRAAGQTFAVPVPQVRRLLRARAEDLSLVDGRDTLTLTDGRQLPVASLVEVLGIAPGPAGRRTGRASLMILSAGGLEAALSVGDFVTEDEVIVKPLGPRLKRIPFVSGATILADGTVALILSASQVVQAARGSRSTWVSVSLRRHATPTTGRILLADDSVTTRSLQHRVLEAAGYEVVPTEDGGEAWDWLQHNLPDLVVADVEMPRMDGLTLCEAIRGSDRLRHLPVILVTGREAAADRASGLHAGANAYLPKSAFDQQQLLDAVARLL